MSYWEELNQPTVKQMILEIAANDTGAATKAAKVWHQLTTQAEREQWRNQLASAVLSYRSSFGRSQIGHIAAEILRNLSEPSANCERCSQPITAMEGRELYSQRIGDARRIHSRCATALLNETIHALAQVPENERDEIYFDI